MAKRKKQRRKTPGKAPVPEDPRENKTPASWTKGLPRWKFLLFSLLPLCLLLAGAEAGVRIAGLAEPKLRTFPLPEEWAGLIAPDPELFWSLRPNLDTMFKGAPVKTNRLGLRAPEISPKGKNEYRILSLGESTTFGMGVGDEETYTALLPQLLQRRTSPPVFTAINAGVSAWSSFQSLRYLELRGLKLDPDLVLFYHELNDYLPSTLRDSSNTEIGVRKTDRELYESHRRSVSRSVIRASALLRFLHSRYAYWRIRALNRDNFENPLQEIGLTDIGIAGRLARVKNDELVPMTLNEKSLGRRVSDEERLQNLSDLVDLCRSHGVTLVVIHPAYRSTSRHDCLLTRFCRDNGVLMYEAYDALHPPGLIYDALFLDSWHPNVEGHRRLAEGLAKFITDRVFAQDAHLREVRK